jgi:hypothetical protein
MPQIQVSQLDEHSAILLKAIELKKQGKLDEYEKTVKQVPLPAYLAKIAKENFGADALVKTGWNLSEAEAEYGPDWLTK